MIEYPIPLIGFSAYSGSGKTTLLTRLLPILRRAALILHQRHLPTALTAAKRAWLHAEIQAAEDGQRAIAGGGRP